MTERTTRRLCAAVAALLLLTASVVLVDTLATDSVAAPQTGNQWRNFNQHATETALQVAVGGFVDTTALHKFGRNAAIGATLETVWDVGGVYVWPTAAQTVAIVSDSAADDGAPAGTGAQTFHIFGLDANYDLVDEVVTLDGTTPVNTTLAYLRVHRGRVETAGTAGSNVGNVSASQNVSALTLFNIRPDTGQTVLGIYTVPRDHVLLATRIFGSIGRAQSTSGEFEFRVRGFGGAFRTTAYGGLNSTGSTWVSIDFPLPPVQIPGRTDIEIRASTSANGSDVNAGFDGYLIDRR